jgi:uncharacterized membrane protein
MNSASLLPVLEVPAAHVRQAFAGSWGRGYSPSGWWPFFEWSAGWSGMIMTYGFWGLLIAGLVPVIRRLALAWKVRMANTTGAQTTEFLKQWCVKGEITGKEFRNMRRPIQ